MTVQDIIIAKLKLTELSALQEIFVAEMEAYIKGYCHIIEIPEALNFTWANMVIDAITAMEGEAAPEGVAGPLSGITMGDVSYSFADRQTAADRYTTIARNYIVDLNRHRKGLFGDDYPDADATI